MDVAAEGKPETAFTTKFGLYRFNVLSCGRTNVPHFFFRLMKYVLKGRQWKSLLLYLDDILVFSKTNEKHVGRLREVLQ